MSQGRDPEPVPQELSLVFETTVEREFLGGPGGPQGHTGRLLVVNRLQVDIHLLCWGPWDPRGYLAVRLPPPALKALRPTITSGLLTSLRPQPTATFPHDMSVSRPQPNPFGGSFRTCGREPTSGRAEGGEAGDHLQLRLEDSGRSPKGGPTGPGVPPVTTVESLEGFLSPWLTVDDRWDHDGGDRRSIPVPGRNSPSSPGNPGFGA